MGNFELYGMVICGFLGLICFIMYLFWMQNRNKTDGEVEKEAEIINEHLNDVEEEAATEDEK